MRILCSARADRPRPHVRRVVEYFFRRRRLRRRCRRRRLRRRCRRRCRRLFPSTQDVAVVVVFVVWVALGSSVEIE